MSRYITILIATLVIISSSIPSYVGIELNSGPFFSASRIITIIILLFCVILLFASCIVLSRQSISSEHCIFVLPAYRVGWILFFYTILMFVSAILSTKLSDSLFTLFSEKQLFGIILLLLGFNIAQSPNSREILERTLIFAVVITIIISAFDYILGYSIFSLFDLPGRQEIKEGFFLVKERLGIIRIQSTMNNPVTYGTFLVMCFPFVILHHRCSNNIISKIFLSIVGILVILLAILTIVRTVIFMLFIQIIILRKVISKQVKIIFYPIMLFLFIGIASTNHELLSEIYDSLVLHEDRTVEHSTKYRIAMLEAGMTRFVQSPIIGVGQNRFSSEVEGEYLGKAIFFEHHENYYLTILIETGILGFMAFMLIILCALLILRRMKKCGDSLYEIYLSQTYMAVIVGWAGMSLFLDSLSFSQISVVFWVLLGIVLAFSKQKKCIKVLVNASAR